MTSGSLGQTLTGAVMLLGSGGMTLKFLQNWLLEAPQGDVKVTQMFPEENPGSAFTVIVGVPWPSIMIRSVGTVHVNIPAPGVLGAEKIVSVPTQIIPELLIVVGVAGAEPAATTWQYCGPSAPHEVDAKTQTLSEVNPGSIKTVTDVEPWPLISVKPAGRTQV